MQGTPVRSRVWWLHTGGRAPPLLRCGLHGDVLPGSGTAGPAAAPQGPPPCPLLLRFSRGLTSAVRMGAHQARARSSRGTFGRDPDRPGNFPEVARKWPPAVISGKLRASHIRTTAHSPSLTHGTSSPDVPPPGTRSLTPLAPGSERLHVSTVDVLGGQHPSMFFNCLRAGSSGTVCRAEGTTLSVPTCLV